MKERTEAHLAGLVDADGHITIVEHQLPNGSVVYSPRLGVANTYFPVMRWLIQQFGGSWRLDKKDRPSHHMVCYQWYPDSVVQMSRILSGIYPYLKIKQEAAHLVSQFGELSGTQNNETRRNLYQEVQRVKNLSSVTTEMPSFSKLDHAYFAGFFDGEGTINISRKYCKKQDKRYYTLAVRVGCTSEQVTKEMHLAYGGSFYWADNRKYKRVFYWDLSNHEVQEKFLLSVLPYLKIKKEQAKIALQWVRLHHKKNHPDRPILWKRLQDEKLVGKMRQSDLTSNRESALAEMQAA